MDDQLRKVLPIETMDGHRFELSVFESLKDIPGPLVICLPAMGVAARHYSMLAGNLIQRGYTVFTADLRGLGSSSLRASRKTNFGYLEMVSRDIAAMVDQVRASYPGRKLILLGHSLGGQLAVIYSGLKPESIDGLILIASGSVFFQNWKFPQNIKVLLSSQLVKIITNILGYFPGKKLGFGGIEAKNVMNDWANFALTGRFKPVGSKPDFESSFTRARIPILGISLEGDWFAPPKSLKNLCDKLVNSRPEFLHLVKDNTPTETLHHFSWIQHSQPIVEKIEAWIKTTF